MDRFEAACGIENAIFQFKKNEHGNSERNSRKEVRRILQEFSILDADKGKSLAQTLETIAKNGDSKSYHSISCFLLRLLSVKGFFTSNSYSWIVSIVENSFSEIYQDFGISENDQTYLKIEKLNAVVNHCYEKLSCLAELSSKIETISETRNTIQRSIADKTLKSFLSPYDFQRVKISVEAILAQVVKLSSTADFTFERKLKDLSDLIQDEIIYCEQNRSFLTQEYYLLFLQKVGEATNVIAAKSKERFVCEISSLRGENVILEKRYPLHTISSTFSVYVPFSNSGPGIAEKVSVTFDMDSDRALIGAERIELGSIAPGEFIIPISVEVFDSCEQLNVLGCVSWQIIGSVEFEQYNFIVTIEAQKAHVDWEYLSSINPYSLEIATGENFYGRDGFVKRLIARTKNGRMDSSYITGQRRVGKSSLAKAVEDHLSIENPNCAVMNIECGDFKGPTPYSTVDTLRDRMELFFSGYLQQSINIQPRTPQTGSLASLSTVLAHLEKTQPENSFLIIIDEFDEINPDLYRYSDIAETFFLNLRSLSGKRNLGFIFIGAEKMTHVMSSQGEKLNKFSKESLDKFSKESEWQDFEKLVKSNIGNHIKWHDSAIISVFSITNGHPFFAKQVCAQIFENVINSKDAEVSSEEVEAAVKQLVSSLDTNSFQHYWRDGIVNPEDVDVVSYKRCQTLAALARTIRMNQDTSVENIQSNISSSKLPSNELLPYLSDFCRRNVLSELNDNYLISIPLFEKWLVNDGLSKLVADQLGDDLHEQRQFKEDSSYVTDEQINELVSSWPDYRGVQFTTHTVRDWLSQVPGHIQQRYLFDLLQRIRFFGQSEIRAGLKSLHDRLKSKLPLIVTTSKAQRRKDVWVTYIDGPGKSGSQYASYYAEENAISNTCVKEIHQLDSYCSGGTKVPTEVKALIIVDDFIGTGSGLSSNLTAFFSKNGEFLKEERIEIYIAVLCATTKGEDKVRSTLSELSEYSDLLVHEYLDRRHYAFDDAQPIWPDESERNRAKDLIQRLGLQADKNRPLGYQDSAMLVVFNRNCPNNTLPILHSRGRGNSAWKPLFERVKH